MGPVKIVIVGAGNRGSSYAEYALENPHLCKVVAVAEPREYHRNRMAQEHNIPEQNVFTDWTQLAALEKIADAAVIATQDRMHVEPTVAFADKGYAILLEKPMAVSEEDCKTVVQAIVRNNVVFAVGHVLRYTPYTQAVKSLIDSGVIGDVLSIQHLEPVGYYHYAHSYVRGNWRREDESSFMLMAKSCHDIDWIKYVIGSRCSKVSSFGSLKHFRKENKPEGAASRCLDCGVEESCPYSAKKIYLDRVAAGHKRWPVHVLVDTVPDIENITEALQKGPYGRCVYDSDNDVVDNQVVIMQFEDGKTATFSMVSTTKDICIRKTRIFGTLGELETTDSETVTHHNFVTGATQVYDYNQLPPNTKLTGHGGADYFLMSRFVDAVAKNDQSVVFSGPIETLESHLIVFAAERARREGTVVDMQQYYESMQSEKVSN